MTKKRVGVMTGGGDVPGLNLAIKSVVLNAVEQDYDVIGIRLGWGGLLRYNLDNPESTKELVQALDVNAVRKVDRTGGTSCILPAPTLPTSVQRTPRSFFRQRLW